jgi:apolipoprotein N-acyltransferase
LSHRPKPEPKPRPQRPERPEQSERPERRLIWIAVSALGGAAWFLSCAKFDIWPLAWIAMIPSLYAIDRAATDRRAFLYGWVTGLTANAGGFYWINLLLQRFAQLPFVAALFLYLLLCGYQGIVFGLFAWLARKIRRATPRWGPLPWAAVAPAVMVACELVVPFVFPWNLAITQAWQPRVIQIADLTGPLGVTALLLAASGGLYDALRRRRLAGCVALAVVLAAVFGYGTLRMSQTDARAAAAPELTVGMVQGNVGFDEKGYEHPELAERQLAEQQDQSVALEAAGAELIVWTESSYPYPLPRSLAREPRGHGLRTRLDAAGKPVVLFRDPLLFGALTFDVDAQGRWKQDVDPYNSAIMLDPDGSFVARFDKMYLVMFSEHIPFVDTFPWLKKVLPHGSGNFSRGENVVTFPLRARDGREYRLGPMICFEDILPVYGRRLGALHPHLLVNITNDAWFGDTSEPWEHMALSVFRAVEQRTALVRAVNTGVTAMIDPVGRVQKRTYAIDPVEDPHPADRLLGRVPMLEAGHTFYARFGDVFGYLCTALTLLAWLVLPRLRLTSTRRRGGG